MATGILGGDWLRRLVLVVEHLVATQALHVCIALPPLCLNWTMLHSHCAVSTPGTLSLVCVYLVICPAELA